MFKVGLVICLISLLINNAQSFELNRLNRTHIECPDETNPGVLVADQLITTRKFEEIHVRVPETGLLNNVISCILIIDRKDGNNDPVINQGGIRANYVEIIIKPWLDETLSYSIQVYTVAPTTTSDASTDF